jgi:hypothetical protein
MADLVFGPRPSRRRVRLPTRLIFVAALAGMMGCSGTVPPPAAENVGALSAGPSTWSAPIHPSTDLTPSFGAVDTGDDIEASTVTTVTRTADAGPDAAELPEIAPKCDGVTTGTVR